MNHSNCAILLLSLGLVSGCAASLTFPLSRSGGERVAADNVRRDASVEMVIRNRTDHAVNVDLNWEDDGGPLPSRTSQGLGGIQGAQTRTFTVTPRWRQVLGRWRISLTVTFVEPDRLALPRPPAHLLGGPPAVEIGPGDRLEWEITWFSGRYRVQLKAHDGPDAN
jgi:hypothetical protein